MKYTHDQLRIKMHAASKTECEKLERAEAMVRDAIRGSSLDGVVDVFGKGSYKNDTNIRNNSDMDVCVCYTPTFFFQLPKGDTVYNHHIELSNNPYTYNQFRVDLIHILQDKFGKENVVPKNKCIHIIENSYHAEIDVSPTWYHRLYHSRYLTDYYDEGVVLWSETGEQVLNYPKQHYDNGVTKNKATKRRYKRLVRIVKNLKVDMEAAEYYRNDRITSFLIESLVYNMPIERFLLDKDTYDWNEMLRNFVFYIWNSTKEESTACDNWKEVSELLQLMQDHKWSKKDVNMFAYKLWNFLEYNKDNGKA